MPIIDMQFKDGIFFAREVGRIDKEDARMWAEQVARLASQSKTPIVALIDALQMTYVTNEARQIFVRASRIPNFKAGVVAARDVVTIQTSRIIGLMAKENHTFVFATLDEARQFAQAQVIEDAAHAG